MTKYPWLLQPLLVPTGAWQTIRIDFVEGLPLSTSKNCVLVIMDKFSKFIHFVPLKHPFVAATIAHVFMQQVYRLHGLPLAIISYRDQIFTSQLWKSLFELVGVSLKMSSVYHPQTYGQTQRVNQCMETYLCYFVSACHHKWVHLIYLAEFWFQASCKSALGFSPFEVLYGYKPRHFGFDIHFVCPTPPLQDWIQEKTVMQQLVQQQLAPAQHHMKTQADKNRV
jgi:transposase InsO family protein